MLMRPPPLHDENENDNLSHIHSESDARNSHKSKGKQKKKQNSIAIRGRGNDDRRRGQGTERSYEKDNDTGSVGSHMSGKSKKNKKKESSLGGRDRPKLTIMRDEESPEPLQYDRYHVEQSEVRHLSPQRSNLKSSEQMRKYSDTHIDNDDDIPVEKLTEIPKPANEQYGRQRQDNYSPKVAERKETKRLGKLFQESRKRNVDQTEGSQNGSQLGGSFLNNSSGVGESRRSRSKLGQLFKQKSKEKQSRVEFSQNNSSINFDHSMDNLQLREESRVQAGPQGMKFMQAVKNAAPQASNNLPVSRVKPNIQYELLEPKILQQSRNDFQGQINPSFDRSDLNLSQSHRKDDYQQQSKHRQSDSFNNKQSLCFNIEPEKNQKKRGLGVTSKLAQPKTGEDAGGFMQVDGNLKSRQIESNFTTVNGNLTSKQLDSHQKLQNSLRENQKYLADSGLLESPDEKREALNRQKQQELQRKEEELKRREQQMERQRMLMEERRRKVEQEKQQQQIKRKESIEKERQLYREELQRKHREETQKQRAEQIAARARQEEQQRKQQQKERQRQKKRMMEEKLKKQEQQRRQQERVQKQREINRKRMLRQQEQEAARMRQQQERTRARQRKQREEEKASNSDTNTKFQSLDRLPSSLSRVQSSQESDRSAGSKKAHGKKKQSAIPMKRKNKVLVELSPRGQDSFYEDSRSNDEQPAVQMNESKKTAGPKNLISFEEEFYEEKIKSKTDTLFYDPSVKAPSSKPPLSRKSVSSKSRPKESSLTKKSQRKEGTLGVNSKITQPKNEGKKMSLIELALQKEYEPRSDSGSEYRSQDSFRSNDYTGSVNSRGSYNSKNSRRSSKKQSTVNIKPNIGGNRPPSYRKLSPESNSLASRTLSHEKQMASATMPLSSANKVEINSKTFISKDVSFIDEKGRLVRKDLIIKGNKVSSGVESKFDEQKVFNRMRNSREKRRSKSRERSIDKSRLSSTERSNDGKRNTFYNTDNQARGYAESDAYPYEQSDDQSYQGRLTGFESAYGGYESSTSFKQANYTNGNSYYNNRREPALHSLKQFIKPIEEAGINRMQTPVKNDPRNNQGRRTMQRTERSAKKY